MAKKKTRKKAAKKAVKKTTRKKVTRKKVAKKAGLTISAYIQHMFTFQQNLISEEELLEDIRAGEKAYEKGEVKVLKSVDDLDKPW